MVLKRSVGGSDSHGFILPFPMSPFHPAEVVGMVVLVSVTVAVYCWGGERGEGGRGVFKAPLHKATVN